MQAWACRIAIQQEKEESPQCSREDDHVCRGCFVTGTGMQVSSSAYPYRRFKLTHEVKIVTRGLPSGHRRRERKGFVVREDKSI